MAEEILSNARDWIATAVMGVLGWFSLDFIRKFRKHGSRIADLERTQVTREDLKNQLDEVRASFTGDVATSHKLLQDNVDSRLDDISETQKLILSKLIPGAGK
jgi:hypothetical protein